MEAYSEGFVPCEDGIEEGDLISRRTQRSSVSRTH